MSRPAIAFIALRLAAIYCWIHGAFFGLTSALLALHVREQFGDMATRAGSPAVEMLTLSMVWSPILQFVCGCLLFIWAPALANKMFPDETANAGEDDSGMGGLALRLLGILSATWLLQLLPVLAQMGEATSEPTPSPAFTTKLVVVTVLALVSAWLIVSGPRIARWLLRARSAGAPDPKSVRFQTIAFSIIGLWILVCALPTVILLLANPMLRRMNSSDGSLSSLASDPWTAEQWSSIVQVVVGVGLFLGSHGLSWLWHRMRTAGVGEPRSEPRERVG